MMVAISAPGLSKSFAIPTLQPDIANGTYDYDTDTIVSSSTAFTLYALLIPNSKNPLSDTYYISAAVTPKVGPLDSNLGSFQFNVTTINVTSDMTYGMPPLEDTVKRFLNQALSPFWGWGLWGYGDGAEDAVKIQREFSKNELTFISRVY